MGQIMKIKTLSIVLSAFVVISGCQVVFGQTQNQQLITSILLEEPTSTFSEDLTGLIIQVTESTVYGYISALVGFGPRVTGSTACYNAGDYIAGVFSGMGLDVEVQPWSYGGYQGNNIEATLEGTGEGDQIYIICAHYDSVPGSPGADDNAAGTAAVMAAAKVMSQYSFAHTVKFIAFSGEEQGLLGSHVYAQEAVTNGDNIIEVLNGDMIGYADSYDGQTHINVYGSGTIAYVSQMICNTYPDLLDLTVVPGSASANSDHWSFIQQGYDAAMYHEYEFNPYYHSSQDTIDKMDMNYDMRVSRLELGTLAHFAVFQPDANGGDDVHVIPPVIVIDDPIEGDYVCGTVSITGMAVDFISYVKNVLVKIDGYNWEYADILGTDGSKTYWNYEWDTTSFSDGECRISAIAINKKNFQSGVFNADVIICNAPLTFSIDAPFNGIINEEIQFLSNVNGGIPPYEYFWEFGDDTISEEPNPGHIYYQAGTYTVSLRVTDHIGNEGIETIVFTVYSNDVTPPTVKITSPENGIYLSNNKVISFFTPVIISNIDIQIDAEDDDSGLDNVKVYIDGIEKGNILFPPYTWSWTETSFGQHTISVTAYDNSGNDANDEITVWKFF